MISFSSLTTALEKHWEGLDTRLLFSHSNGTHLHIWDSYSDCTWNSACLCVILCVCSKMIPSFTCMHGYSEEPRCVGGTSHTKYGRCKLTKLSLPLHYITIVITTNRVIWLARQRCLFFIDTCTCKFSCNFFIDTCALGISLYLCTII